MPAASMPPFSSPHSVFYNCSQWLECPPVAWSTASLVLSNRKDVPKLKSYAAKYTTYRWRIPRYIDSAIMRSLVVPGLSGRH